MIHVQNLKEKRPSRSKDGKRGRAIPPTPSRHAWFRSPHPAKPLRLQVAARPLLRMAAWQKRGNGRRLGMGQGAGLEKQANAIWGNRGTGSLWPDRQNAPRGHAQTQPVRTGMVSHRRVSGYATGSPANLRATRLLEAATAREKRIAQYAQRTDSPRLSTPSVPNDPAKAPKRYAHRTYMAVFAHPLGTPSVLTLRVNHLMGGSFCLSRFAGGMQ